MIPSIPIKNTDLLIHKLKLRGQLILENEQNYLGWQIFAEYFTSDDLDEEGTVIAHHPNIDVNGRAKFNFQSNHDETGGKLTINVFCIWAVKANKFDASVYDIKISDESIIISDADIDVYASTTVDRTNYWEPKIYKPQPAFQPAEQFQQPFFRQQLSPEHLLNIERKKMREWNELASAPGSCLLFKDTTALDSQWEEIKRKKRFGF